MFLCASEGAQKHRPFQSPPGNTIFPPLPPARDRRHIRQLKPFATAITRKRREEKAHFFARRLLLDGMQLILNNGLDLSKW